MLENAVLHNRDYAQHTCCSNLFLHIPKIDIPFAPIVVFFETFCLCMQYFALAYFASILYFVQTFCLYYICLPLLFGSIFVVVWAMFCTPFFASEWVFLCYVYSVLRAIFAHLLNIFYGIFVTYSYDSILMVNIKRF